MNLKLQLKILSFLQFCLWGSWLTTLGSYMFVTLKFDGASIGAVYSSLGIAAVLMPTLLGIVADKWISAKWVYAFCHLVGAVTLFMAAGVTTPVPGAACAKAGWAISRASSSAASASSATRTLCPSNRRTTADMRLRVPVVDVAGEATVDRRIRQHVHPPARDADEDAPPDILTFHDTANAVATRADLSHFMEWRFSFSSQQELDGVRDAQDALDEQLSREQRGILAFSRVENMSARVATYYVEAPVHAVQLAGQLGRQHVPELKGELSVSFDPAWNEFLSLYAAIYRKDRPEEVLSS